MNNPITYELWHDRYDGREGHDKLLGVYSTREKAEQGLAMLRDKPGFRDHPDGFVITQGTIDQTDMTNGFVTVRDNSGEHDEPIRDAAPLR